MEDIVRGAIPVGRMGQKADIALACVYLASMAGRWVRAGGRGGARWAKGWSGVSLWGALPCVLLFQRMLPTPHAAQMPQPTCNCPHANRMHMQHSSHANRMHSTKRPLPGSFLVRRWWWTAPRGCTSRSWCPGRWCRCSQGRWSPRAAQWGWRPERRGARAASCEALSACACFGRRVARRAVVTIDPSTLLNRALASRLRNRRPPPRGTLLNFGTRRRLPSSPG